MNTELDRAIRFAQSLAVEFGEDYVVHFVPEWGPNGGHYDEGYRVYRSRPQEPGGLLPPPTEPLPGRLVATLSPSARPVYVGGTWSTHAKYVGEY